MAASCSSWARGLAARTVAAALAVLGAAGAAMAQGGSIAPGSPGETSGPTTWWLPPNVSTMGEEVDRVFYVILWLTSITCVGVFAVLGWFLVHYRHRPGRSARYTHGNARLELAWTLVPTVILALLAAFSQTSWSAIKYTSAMPSGPDVLEMEVVAQQFAWNFHYPGQDGKLGRSLVPERINKNSGDPAEQIGLDRSGEGADDLVTVQMYVPVNRPVYIHLTSLDVIHSFFLPHFRVKQDATPGLNARVWLEATRTSAEVIGTNADGSPKPFDIVCAELCGSGHYRMKGMLFVVSEAEYEAFLEREAAYLPSGEDDWGDGY